MKKENKENKMLSAVCLYKSRVDGKAEYHQEGRLKEAKELIINRLNDPELELENSKDTFHGRNEPYTSIYVTIARTPREGWEKTPGIGEYKRWFIIWYLNRDKFPTEELNEWLKDFGWKFYPSGDEDYFEIKLRSAEFDTDVLNEAYWKEKRRYWPTYM